MMGVIIMMSVTNMMIVTNIWFFYRLTLSLKLQDRSRPHSSSMLKSYLILHQLYSVKSTLCLTDEAHHKNRKSQIHVARFSNQLLEMMNSV